MILILSTNEISKFLRLLHHPFIRSNCTEIGFQITILLIRFWKKYVLTVYRNYNYLNRNRHVQCAY